MFRAEVRYGWPIIGVHWLTVLLILVAFVIGLVMGDLTLSPLKLKLFSWHKWVGLTVLALLLPRVILRAFDRLKHADDLLPWEARLSSAVHGMIYLLMFVAPMLGWLQSSAKGFPVVWFGVLALPDLVHKDKALGKLLEQLHEAAVYTLIALIVLHALAALYHQFMRHDDVLARMAPWVRKRR